MAEKKVVKAIRKYVRSSPQKARLVVNLIRGKSAEEALHMLKFVEKSVAKDVYKVLASAIANAENNEDMDKEKLIVTEAKADKAFTFKRGRWSGRRFKRILKRNCHITVGVGEK